MNDTESINEAIIAAGVVWRSCAACGRRWPFPTGTETEAERVFQCQGCVSAVVAAMTRRALEGGAARPASRRLVALFVEAFAVDDPAMVDLASVLIELNRVPTRR